MTHTTYAKSSPTRRVSLPAAIAQLSELSSGSPILSAYVDTSPQRREGQAYLLALRGGYKAIRPQLALGDEVPFELAASRVERFLNDEFTQRGQGLALFAGAPVEGLIVVQLPRPPLTEHVSWDARAELTPLEAMLDDAERVAVVLFDTHRTRLYTVFLGDIENRQVFTDHVPARQSTGGWFALQQANFARHREDHLRRHVQHTVHALMELLRTSSFDRLLVAGPEEPLSVLRHQLPGPLRSRLAGELDVEMPATDAEVLAAALKAAERVEREEEVRLVEELLDGASTRHAVLGLTGTLDALADGRLHLLFLTEALAATGAQCCACGRLVADHNSCPACGSTTTPVPNLREAIVQQALAENAKVEVVAGPAAIRLLEHGGIGGWTRF